MRIQKGHLTERKTIMKNKSSFWAIPQILHQSNWLTTNIKSRGWDGQKGGRPKTQPMEFIED